VDFLEAHPEFAICFHPVKVNFEDGFNGGDVSHIPEIFPAPSLRFEKTMLDLDDLLKVNFIQTNSAMYRWRFNNEKIEKVFPRNIMPCDWYLHLLHAQTGPIGFIDEVMAVYRRHPNGIWSSNLNSEKFHLKYGLLEMGFFDCVYKNIAPSPFAYRAETGIPGHIIDIFIKYNCLEEITCACKQFPEYMAFLLLQHITTITSSDSYHLLKKLKSNSILKTLFKAAKIISGK
jgi:hypothetical protein